MTIKRFEALNGNTYTFPTALGDQDFHTNFKALLQRSARLPGADGGLREFGAGRAPSPVGNIQFSIYLESDTRAGMQTLRDNLNALADWGVGRLFDDLNGTERWAWCAVSNIDMSEERHKQTDYFQPVQLSFEVPEPFWMRAGNQTLWDSTYDWDSTIDWDEGTFTSVTGSGTLTVTTNGNAYTHGRFVAKVTGAQAFNQLLIQRLVNNRVSDQVLLGLTCVQNDVIEIDPRRQWALVNGANQLANFDFLFPDWMRLLPGANSIKVTLDEPTAQIDALVYYFDRYT